MTKYICSLFYDTSKEGVSCSSFSSENIEDKRHCSRCTYCLNTKANLPRDLSENK